MCDRDDDGNKLDCGDCGCSKSAQPHQPVDSYIEEGTKRLLVRKCHLCGRACLVSQVHRCVHFLKPLKLFHVCGYSAPDVIGNVER